MLDGISRKTITNACRFIILVVVEMIITMTPKIRVLKVVHRQLVRKITVLCVALPCPLYES